MGEIAQDVSGNQEVIIAALSLISICLISVNHQSISCSLLLLKNLLYQFLHLSVTQNHLHSILTHTQHHHHHLYFATFCCMTNGVAFGFA
jgi:hypothetical protein